MTKQASSSKKPTKPLSLAYFLPQFHEVPENNEWWGAGFTEWSNLVSAKRFFKWQRIRKPVGPHEHYNLLDEEVLKWHQATALQYGIDGFLVWDYWFGEGKKLLEQPMGNVLIKSVDFKYCFAWANHSWYNKTKGILLQEQKYLGESDYKDYFFTLLPHFLSANYIKISNRIVFGIFRPMDVPDLDTFLDVFNKLAKENGFDGVYFIGENTPMDSEWAERFDRIIDTSAYFSISRRVRSPTMFVNLVKEFLIRRKNWNFLGPVVYDYKKLILGSAKIVANSNKSIPCVLSGWDTTPRHGRRGTILKNFNEEVFSRHLDEVFTVLDESPSEDRIVVIKSWNEWAEGNLLEPDSVFGFRLLEMYRDKVSQRSSDVIV